MFTDLVGYSVISSRDERKAIKLLEEHRRVLQAVFERHGGVTVKTIGDGLVCGRGAAAKHPKTIITQVWDNGRCVSQVAQRSSLRSSYF
jgi:class 3 adenylate cyclase